MGRVAERPRTRVLRVVASEWPFPRGRTAVLRIAARLSRPDDVFVVEPGVLARVELHDYMVRSAFSAEFVRDPAFVAARRLLRPGDLVIDIGANVGLWALGAARAVGASGRVIAFEPVPSTAARLADNVALNHSSVQIERVAVTSTADPVTIYEASHGNSGGAGLLRRAGVDRAVEVPAVTLDGYLAARALGLPDVVKVDIEGAEAFAFEGAAATLGHADAPVVVFEVNPEAAEGLGVPFDAAANMLVAHGYRLHAPTRTGLERIDRVERRHQDVVALKPSREDRVRSRGPGSPAA